MIGAELYRPSEDEPFPTSLRVDTDSGWFLQQIFELVCTQVHDDKGTVAGRKAEITLVSRRRYEWSLSCRIEDLTDNDEEPIIATTTAPADREGSRRDKTKE